MAVRNESKFDTIAPKPPSPPGWPSWKRRLISALLLFHLIALGVAVAAAPPSSALERALASAFGRYYELVDQGYAYRYYAPEPPPTPVVTATVRFADGRPEVIVRLPQRGLRPRLRYQRQLALAFHLFSDFDEARRVAGDGSRSRWARSYARHLVKAWPGCATVTLSAQMHLIPDPRRVLEAASTPGAPRVDLDAEEFYTTPERIGEFSCDAL